MLASMMRTCALLWLLPCLVASVTWADEMPLPADSLAVQAADGGTVSFADLLGPDGRAVCFAFLHPACPLAQEYAPVLSTLAADFGGEGIRFVGVICECDDPAEVDAYRREYGITFPIHLDTNFRLAEALDATITPEVVLVDRDRIIRYSGRIDDRYKIRGVMTPGNAEPELANAIQDLLAGREIAYLANPVDALVLQIQGSGRVRITQPDGSVRQARLAYAGSNEQPYKSVGRWLLDQGALRDASWPSIKSWVAQNPDRVNEMLWSNPRTVFFREEPLTDLDAVWGPRGAQGVALTPGRSIAVDPLSIPFGTPVWLVSSGATTQLRKLVLAQDAGSAIIGAVRADYFVGWGKAAEELAGRLKQPVHLWVLWPK